MTSAINFWDGWKADQDEALHDVWVLNGAGGETRQLPFKTIQRLDFWPVCVQDLYSPSIGYVPREWWLRIGKPYVAAHDTAVFRAHRLSGKSPAIERFVQDAERWFKGLPN